MLLKTSRFLLSLENEVYKGYTPCSGCDSLCHSLASGLTVVRAKQGTLACLPRSLEAILRNCKGGAARIFPFVKHIFIFPIHCPNCVSIGSRFYFVTLHILPHYVIIEHDDTFRSRFTWNNVKVFLKIFTQFS